MAPLHVSDLEVRLHGATTREMRLSSLMARQSYVVAVAGRAAVSYQFASQLFCDPYGASDGVH